MKKIRSIRRVVLLFLMLRNLIRYVSIGGYGPKRRSGRKQMVDRSLPNHWSPPLFVVLGRLDRRPGRSAICMYYRRADNNETC